MLSNREPTPRLVTRTRSLSCPLPRMRPSQDLGLEPEAWTAAAQIYDWAGHVRIHLLIRANRVPMRESKDPGHAVSVN